MKSIYILLIVTFWTCSSIFAQESIQTNTPSDSANIAAPQTVTEPEPTVTSDTTIISNGDSKKLWNAAEEAYIVGKYPEAIKFYEQILSQGLHSTKLYYNLANAYYKIGAMGKAILFYNKALRLSPSDADAKYNLTIANTFIQDKIESVPQFFVKRWVSELRMGLSSNSWAIGSIITLMLALLSLLTYLLSRKLIIRKGGFYGAIIFTIFFIILITFATSQKDALINPNEAIVMIGAAPVKSSPDTGSKDLFVLHEGTKVTILSSLNQWKEIMIADGNKGWIQQSSIQMID